MLLDVLAGGGKIGVVGGSTRHELFVRKRNARNIARVCVREDLVADAGVFPDVGARGERRHAGAADNSYGFVAAALGDDVLEHLHRDARWLDGVAHVVAEDERKVGAARLTCERELAEGIFPRAFRGPQGGHDIVAAEGGTVACEPFCKRRKLRERTSGWTKPLVASL